MFRDSLAGLVLVFVFVAALTSAAEPVRKPYGIERRQLWTTGNIHGTPEPPDPYRIENAFPRLTLFEPLAVDRVPGANRFGVATRPGKIFTFEIRPDVEEAELLVDVGRTVYGLAFHPRFAENGYLYVGWNAAIEPEKKKRCRITRFRMTCEAPITIDPNSALEIISWESDGHNGAAWSPPRSASRSTSRCRRSARRACTAPRPGPPRSVPPARRARRSARATTA